MIAPAQGCLAGSAGANEANEANDRMLALPADLQAGALSLAIGRDCASGPAFFMGESPASHVAFWSVRCGDGQAYMVGINPDSTGSTKVTNCATLQAVGVHCFRRLGGN